MRFYSLIAVLLIVTSQLSAQTHKLDLKEDSVLLLAADQTRTSFSRFIADNKGKVIYIDIWASWCRPCLQEMPSSHTLKEKLNGEPVVFLYLSVDEEFENWQQAVQRFGLKEENSFYLVNARESPLVDKLKISSIPRYVVIDKNGKIINKDAPRPSESRTYAYLLKLGKKE